MQDYPYPPGTRIGGLYEVVAQPRLGGMGVVYPCLDLEEGRPVVLKTFKREYLPNRASRDRFLREGTYWVNLGAHPHIVRCYRTFIAEDVVFLVLEMVAREQGREDASLRAWLTPGVPLAAKPMHNSVRSSASPGTSTMMATAISRSARPITTTARMMKAGFTCIMAAAMG